MCAIAGILRFAEGGDSAPALQRMLDVQRHRGPDAEGVFMEGPMALGHRRLSIIDLSQAANQPMADATGRYLVSFNGEIYNFQQVKAELKDYSFRTHSDTEVILAAFAAWGENCLTRLKGQFAFALWDRLGRKLFIARDRLGEKPFYYHLDSQRLVFASELRALLESGLVPRRISQAGLMDYLVNESVRSPRSMVEGVHQLPPGHFAWVSDRGDLRIQRYWNILAPAAGPGPATYEEACQGVRERLDRAIEGQMISDVPLGVFLSGGIDSSAIAGLMAQRSERPIDTLSIAFDESAFDESVHAQAVATRFRTRHHVVRLKPTALLDELPAYFAAVDAPSGDGPNTYVVSKAAKQAGLTVALSGVGGDELFCGYRYFRWYRAFMKHSAFWRLPLAGRRLVSRAFRGRKMAPLLTLGAKDADGFYELVRSAFVPGEARKVLAAGRGDSEASVSVLDREAFFSLPLLSQCSALEFTNYTRNVLLKDTDSLAMAHSLEVRVPFCDHDLVEYVLAVPDRFKFPTTPKRLLIDALGDLLPDSIVNRPKMGFAFPWGRWMKEDLGAFCGDSLATLGQRGLFDPLALEGMWRAFRAQTGEGGWSRLWLLVALEQWIRKTGVEA